MTIIDNFHQTLKDIEDQCIVSQRSSHEVSLIVISKQRSLEEIQCLYTDGCRDFGENRVQEALEKIERAPSDIRWHFVGKLQTNKVNKILGKFALIHSVDSLHLAEKISQGSCARNLVTSVLLEVNTSGEASKSGLSQDEWRKIFSSVFALKGIRIKGLMTMAPMTEDETMIRLTFSRLRQFQKELQNEFGCHLEILSMGMSQDYPIAISEGATMLRIGSQIFE